MYTFESIMNLVIVHAWKDFMMIILIIKYAKNVIICVKPAYIQEYYVKHVLIKIFTTDMIFLMDYAHVLIIFMTIIQKIYFVKSVYTSVKPVIIQEFYVIHVQIKQFILGKMP